MSIELKEKLYTSTQVADVLGVSLRTLYRYMEDGKIQSMRTASGRHRFTRENILEFLNAGGVSSVTNELLSNQVGNRATHNVNDNYANSGLNTLYNNSENNYNQSQLRDKNIYNNTNNYPNQNVDIPDQQTSFPNQQGFNNNINRNQWNDDNNRNMTNPNKYNQNLGFNDQVDNIGVRGNLSNINQFDSTKLKNDLISDNNLREEHLSLNHNQYNQQHQSPKVDGNYVKPSFNLSEDGLLNNKKSNNFDFYDDSDDLFSFGVKNPIMNEEKANEIKVPNNIQSNFSINSGAYKNEIAEIDKDNLKYYKSEITDLIELAKKICDTGNNNDLDYGFTLYAGLSLHFRVKPFEQLHFYANPEDLKIWRESLRLTESSKSEADVVIYLNSDVVFIPTKSISGYKVVEDRILLQDLSNANELDLVKEFRSRIARV